MSQDEDRRVVSIRFLPPLLSKTPDHRPIRRTVRFADGSTLMDTITAAQYRAVCDEFAPTKPAKEKD